MPESARISKLVFVVVPEAPGVDPRDMLRTAQMACRVGHLLGFLPFSPLLHYGSYLSQGEFAQDIGELSKTWFRRSDRIWLRHVSEEDDRLDPVSYDILEDNNRKGRRTNNLVGRRPVYQLHKTGDERVGYIPVPMSREDVQDVLDINVTIGVSRAHYA